MSLDQDRYFRKFWITRRDCNPDLVDKWVQQICADEILVCADDGSGYSHDVDLSIPEARLLRQILDVLLKEESP